jgi:signal transduction histidine kinase/CheY-like chemotaxis protein/HPt (histidine-containing phosphotransfer) domain-containing protein
MNDSMLQVQIDTISKLIEEDILIWNEMLNLYHSDSLDTYIRKLTARLAVGTLSNKNTEGSILKRVFGKKPDKNQVQQEIIRDLHAIEKQDSIHNIRLLETESQLAVTSREIRERFYIIIGKMEDEVTALINANAKAADILAMKTYRWLAMFALLGTLLVILVLAIVVRYVKKTRDYQKALIKSKEETEKLARTREMFMANMSHEIRTPVNAIYGFAEQLTYRSDDEKGRKIVDIIRSSADHLVKIVNDVLDFSKLQNARIVLEQAPFDVRLVCEEVQLLFENKSAEKNTRLHHSVGITTPRVLLGDSHRLKQIMINLVGNAVKFTENGEIQFSAECEFISGNNLNLILKVSDTGIGISEEMHDRVFDDFTQAEPDTGSKYGGTGLGLSIVKKLVELHQGSITLQSKKNRGTTVTCILPCKAGNEEELPYHPGLLKIPGHLRDLKILVVDDEEYNRLLFKTILDRWNIRYDEAGDGHKAIELIKSSRYDMVFMDIRMPGLNGIESAKWIRDELNISRAEMPLIGISATHTEEDIRKYRLSGIDHFLPKPFTEKMLLDVILSALNPPDLKSASGDTGKSGLRSNPDPGINLSNLYHLAGDDIPFVRQMLSRFMESTEQGLIEIHEAIDEGKISAVMETAHKISAPCMHIGAEQLYDNLKAIEKEANDGGNKKILKKLSVISDSQFAAIKKKLNEHLLKMNE